MFLVPQSVTSKLQFAFVGVFGQPLSICRNFTRAASNQQSASKVVGQRQYLKLRNHLANNTQWLHQERQNNAKLSGLRSRSAWEGDGSARIELMPKGYRIEKGDIIYVQKKPGFLEVPMIAGTVTQCETDYVNPLLWKIAVEPTSNVKDIKSVTVIVMNSQKYNKAVNVRAATQV